MKINKFEANIGDVVTLLGQEYEIGERVQLTFNTYPVHDLQYAWQAIGYLMGACPYSQYRPGSNDRKNKKVVLWSSFNPVMSESVNPQDTVDELKNCDLDLLMYVERLQSVPKKKGEQK